MELYEQSATFDVPVTVRCTITLPNVSSKDEIDDETFIELIDEDILSDGEVTINKYDSERIF